MNEEFLMNISEKRGLKDQQQHQKMEKRKKNQQRRREEFIKKKEGERRDGSMFKLAGWARLVDDIKYEIWCKR